MLVFISVGGVDVPEGGEEVIRAPALGGGEPVFEDEGGEGGDEVIRAPALGGGEPVFEDDEPVLGGDNNEDICAAAPWPKSCIDIRIIMIAGTHRGFR